jgi:hypothetical protein
MKKSFLPYDVVTRYFFATCQDTRAPLDGLVLGDIARRKIMLEYVIEFWSFQKSEL